MGSGGRTGDPVALAGRIADEVLFPAALDTDGAAAVPAGHLDLLAEVGLYGLAGPAEAGGLGADRATGWAVVEALAGGCLATAFVWVQHHGLVRALAAGPPGPLRDELLAPLCRGERRAGVALAGLLPGPPRLRAEPVVGGWSLAGTSPWVTGWGAVDVLQVAARGPDGRVVWLAVDAVGGAGLAAERQRLVAVDASATVRLHFDGVVVPGRRVVREEAYDDAVAGQAGALRTNGSLALGLAGRCCRLLGATPLAAELERCRTALDRAGPDDVLEARAAAAELALRAAAAVVVAGGSGSVLADHHGQRLAREAVFLLVFGSRPGIRAGLLRRLGAGGGQPGP